MKNPSMKSVIKTTVVAAFTFTAALIWRDVIVLGIELFLPTENVFLYELLAAIIATILVILMIYIFLKTEDEAEYILKKYKKHWKFIQHNAPSRNSKKRGTVPRKNKK